MEKKQKLLPAEGRDQLRGELLAAPQELVLGGAGGVLGGGCQTRSSSGADVRTGCALALALALAVLPEEAPGPVTDTSGSSIVGVQLDLALEMVQELVWGQRHSGDTRGLQEITACPPSHRPLQRQIPAQAFWRPTSSQAESA